MLSTGTCVKIVAVSLLALAVQHFGRLAIQLGTFSHFHSHYPGPCKKIENMQPGSEDFYTLPNGLTFITSGFRLQRTAPSVEEFMRRRNVKGRIYLFDFNKADAGVKELKIASTGQFNVDTFHPHGISVWEENETGRHVVFVVNHPTEEPPVDRIEKFVFDPEKLELIHQAYYSSETMKVVNNVQSSGENSFYFTNYQYFLSPLGVIFEVSLQLEWTDVVYFDGQSYTVVANGIKQPNGVTMSHDGQYLYVAAPLGQEIRVYRRNKDNSLTLQQVYPLHTAADNILIDRTTGDLYLGCHPVLYKIVGHMEHPDTEQSPSQVLQLRVKDGNITSAQEIFYDQGDLISASASAMIYNRKLLIGSYDLTEYYIGEGSHTIPYMMFHLDE